MNIRLQSLDLQFKQANDKISFADFTYFYGKMGAGKSSIARLIDYCFGGNLDLSPALQSEFVSAKLNLIIDNLPASFERIRDSQQLVATWQRDNENYEVVVPSKDANGEIVPQTGIENLSDLIFYLADIKAPKVRKNKSKEDSELARLSMRNLLWYCYLDQDSMDSSFFHLDTDAAFYNRNTSKDVLRYVVGFHQEQVAELETELSLLRDKRNGLDAAAKSLREALSSGDIAGEKEIENHLIVLQQELTSVNEAIASSRDQTRTNIPHLVDTLRKKARFLASELANTEDAIAAVETTIENDKRHLNELQMLKVKFRRSSSAKSILAGVEFATCPRCQQRLPDRGFGICMVCGQDEPSEFVESKNNLNLDVIDSDATSRINELNDIIQRHSVQLSSLKRRLQEFLDEKMSIDQTMTESMRTYDSAYLASTLDNERKRAEIDQTVLKLREYLRLSRKDVIRNNFFAHRRRWRLR